MSLLKSNKSSRIDAERTISCSSTYLQFRFIIHIRNKAQKQKCVRDNKTCRLPNISCFVVWRCIFLSVGLDNAECTQKQAQAIECTPVCVCPAHNRWLHYTAFPHWPVISNSWLVLSLSLFHSLLLSLCIFHIPIPVHFDVVRVYDFIYSVRPGCFCVVACTSISCVSEHIHCSTDRPFG